MLLTDWLAREGITRSEFANRIGVSAATISDLCQGNQWLSRRTARAIARATGGEVTADDFVHLEPESNTPLVPPSVPKPQGCAA
jgi:3,4-dihydroxy 2-butanone 4-phosphate synthase/GTP cyclohydrolase II